MIPATPQQTGPIFRQRSGIQSPRQMAAMDPLDSATAPVDASPSTIEQTLLTQLTSGYRPRLPIWGFREENYTHLDFYFDIESMLRHNCITTPLSNVLSPFSQMQVQVEASSQRVAKWFVEEWTKFLEMHVPSILKDGAPYGWAGAEPVYEIDHGKLTVADLKDFSPRDVQPLIKNSNVCGIRVNNIPSGSVDLSGSNRGFPAKGFYYAHRPRSGQYYGTSQIEGAWKPWRRLTARDGVEENIDLALYKYAVGTTVMWAPFEDSLATNQPAALNVRQSGMQRCQEMVENMKSGGGAVLPSAQYPNGQPKYDLKFENPQMNIPELIQAADALYTECSKAIGFPPELIEAAETGSGFSGRMIPLQTFLISLQPVAQALFHAWYKQIGRPLLWWNFGRNAWVRPKVVQLLKSYRQASMPQPPAPPPQASASQAAGAQPGAQPAPMPGAAQSGDQPAAPGPDGKTPYQGPRGGQGFRDATGRISYVKHLSTGYAAFDSASRSLFDGQDDSKSDRALAALAKRLPELEPEELDALETELAAV